MSCPVTLRLTDDQRATLECAGIPGWAIDAVTVDRVASWTGNPDQRKHPHQWRQLLAHVVRAHWNDPSKRPQPPTQEPDKEASRAAHQRYLAELPENEREFADPDHRPQGKRRNVDVGGIG